MFDISIRINIAIISCTEDCDIDTILDISWDVDIYRSEFRYLSLLVGVGSKGVILGHVLKPKCSAFFSLSYIPNKTKQPKIMRFGPIKMFAPQKSEAETAWPKIRIFALCPNIFPHNSPLSTLRGYIWLWIVRRDIRALIKAN